MIGKKLKEFHRKQQPIIREILKLEKKYGMELVRGAFTRHFIKVREEQKRLKEIKKMEGELEILRRSKL